MKQRESSVPTCCNGYILEQGFYCIVFYIKIYTQCINVWKDSTNVKSSPVYSVPFKAGVLQPHTGKSSQKTKEVTPLGVSGEPVLDPKTNIKKGFIFRSVQFEQSRLFGTPAQELWSITYSRFLRHDDKKTSGVQHWYRIEESVRTH